MELVIALLIAAGLIANDIDQQTPPVANASAVVAAVPERPLPVCDIAFADLSQTISVRRYRNTADQDCRLGEQP